ncbi:MAG: anaerobic ribonucleoside-triphosphate reductase activating protein [Muribaculaceae bacterium]|nr:anaerobic ribonucleoside-triphosphate reductase activating protein [Muribaculaceae bacterium]MDE5929243.1 anaerobic ribonucleoside-triphosphate reductase activating protein [Muribaculaceae bacterium]MDE6130435.1 anaerobic ribonucleoside-triphosphate reductase activating protein [Muribaculaceae bacterium]
MNNSGSGHTLNVAGIIDGTAVDGPGLRTSIYFAGCRHHCPGCHNPSTWAFGSGTDTGIDELLARIADNGFDVTFSGGDPMYQAENLIPLARAVKAAGRNIWCYTGFIYEDIMDKEPYKTLLQYIDVLVDGPYMENLRDPGLPFRGSSNQRLIHLRNGIRQS